MSGMDFTIWISPMVVFQFLEIFQNISISPIGVIRNGGPVVVVLWGTTLVDHIIQITRTTNPYNISSCLVKCVFNK